MRSGGGGGYGLEGGGPRDQTGGASGDDRRRWEKKAVHHCKKCRKAFTSQQLLRYHHCQYQEGTAGGTTPTGLFSGAPCARGGAAEEGASTIDDIATHMALETAKHFPEKKVADVSERSVRDGIYHLEPNPVAACLRFAG